MTLSNLAWMIVYQQYFYFHCEVKTFLLKVRRHELTSDAIKTISKNKKQKLMVIYWYEMYFEKVVRKYKDSE